MATQWLALWTAADKALPMLYGVAALAIAASVMPKEEWGAWTNAQMVFMIISLLGDFFLLQPLVKISSEERADRRPIATATLLLYGTFSLLLAVGVMQAPWLLASILKTPEAAPSFRLMVWIVAANIIRSVAIRILQIDYRIIAIFLVDFAYYAPLIGLMIVGGHDGSFHSAETLMQYNVIAFAASSVVGLVLTGRSILPTTRNLGHSIRHLLSVGFHQGGTGVLTVMQQQGDLAIVTGVRGGVAVGVYNAARTFYRFFDALRDAAQLLLVPATSRAYSQGRLDKVEEVSELATAALFALMLPLSVGMVALAPVVVPLVLRNFPEAVDEFQWLMANGVLVPFVIVPSAVLLGIGHTRDLFRATLVGTVALITAGLVFTYLWGSVGMAAGTVVGTATTAALLTHRMNRFFPFTLRSILHRSRAFGPLLRARLQRGRAGAGSDD